MNSKRMLIRGGQIYDHDGDVHKPAVADLLIEGDKILSIGPQLALDGANEVIDAAGRLILPGLINAHYHSHDVLCRGLFEELPLEIWLLYTLPMGADRSKEEVRARTLVGALECLRCGITTVQDMLGLSPLNDEQTDVVISAYREAGIRVVFSPMVWDIPPIAMVRHKDSLPPAVQEMLGNKPRPIREQFEYLEHQFNRHPAGGHPALGHCSVCATALHAEDAARLCGTCAQARSAGVHPCVRDARPGPDRTRPVQDV